MCIYVCVCVCVCVCVYTYIYTYTYKYMSLRPLGFYWLSFYKCIATNSTNPETTYNTSKITVAYSKNRFTETQILLANTLNKRRNIRQIIETL